MSDLKAIKDLIGNVQATTLIEALLTVKTIGAITDPELFSQTILRGINVQTVLKKLFSQTILREIKNI